MTPTPQMPSPYDESIEAIETGRQSYMIHTVYALETLRGKRQGWLDALKELLPLLKGMLDIESRYEGLLEFKITDADKALIKQVEEVVK